MRLVLYFDLPSVKSIDKRNYTRFVKMLKKEGFVMLQESVYSKLAITQSVADATITRIRKDAPREGIILVHVLTEKQFNNMHIITGEVKSDVINTDERTIEL